MSWSFSVPATRPAAFPAAVDDALAKANVQGQNPDGVDSANLAAKTVKELVAAWDGARTGQPIAAELRGHSSPKPGVTNDSLSIVVEVRP